MNNPFRVLVFFIIKFYKSLSVSLEIVFKLVGFLELFLQASDSIFAISAPFIIFHIPVFKINSISSNSILGEAIVLQIHENVVKLFFHNHLNYRSFCSRYLPSCQLQFHFDLPPIASKLIPMLG